ncbi:hypothetical protein B0T18DRAFT_409033 [Schizothecium vesticola]|uniref:Uncharacterized protein n=1 Tax=Schizothecium vesticola TaxID=314040 RepID=A0AA40F3N7_9PEZI|nr:hypothetical protein B0T18DRAFT_409033 [Schizothecium vesticola]
MSENSDGSLRRLSGGACGGLLAALITPVFDRIQVVRQHYSWRNSLFPFFVTLLVATGFS